VASIEDPGVARLLEAKNHAVVSTLNEDGSVHSTVVWVDVEAGRRHWPNNLERNPSVTVVVYDESNPYDYVEVRGTVESRLEGADAHIDRLAKKYMGVDAYPFRTPDEQRITYLVDATRVRHQKQR
jgi:PPOX class probable F420-dependent enzyme